MLPHTTLSNAVLALSRLRSTPLLERGWSIHLGALGPPWTARTLVADLGPMLSAVSGREWKATVVSRFGGFHTGSAYAAYLDPDSPWYQVWLGSYIVLDGPDGRRFGFPTGDAPDVGEVLDVLEADQRLVFRTTSCPRRFEDGRATRPVGPLAFTAHEEGWWRLRGSADTWSSYCRGGHARRRARWLYGVLPARAAHPVEDFHPLRYHGDFRLRRLPALGATWATFLIAPEYVDAHGRRVDRSAALLGQAEALLPAITLSAAA